jgi:ATPase subunit of ABC transporter with duplicated ATPase domains
MKDHLLQLNNISFKYNDSPEFILRDINLHFSRGWSWIVGANGSGKTTLLKLASKKLMPTTGNFIRAIKMLLSYSINLNHEDGGRIFTIISRLNSDPKRLLDCQLPSLGEVRKLMIAHALLNSQVLIIDKPTNHMDLPSIKCVEKALQDYQG